MRYYRFVLFIFLWLCLGYSAFCQNPNSKSSGDSVLAKLKEIENGERIQREDSTNYTRIIPDLKKKLLRLKRTGNIYSEDQDCTYWFGNIFSKKHTHLLVESTPPFMGIVSYDIFLLENNHFKEVYHNDEAVIELTGKGIMDINGDGNCDFYITSYSSSGCCLRSAYTIALYNDSSGGFKEVELLNPTFYPRKKLVYTMGYGQPQNTGIDKFRWEGQSLIQLSSIYPETEEVKRYLHDIYKNGKVIKTDTLLHVPKEYKQTDNYDWVSEFWK